MQVQFLLWVPSFSYITGMTNPTFEKARIAGIELEKFLLDPTKYENPIECKHDALDGCPQTGSVYWYRSFLETEGNYRLVLAGSRELSEFPPRGEYYLALPKGFKWLEVKPRVRVWNRIMSRILKGVKRALCL